MKKRNAPPDNGFGKNKKDRKKPADTKQSFEKANAARKTGKSKKEMPPEGSLLAGMIKRDAEEEQATYNKTAKGKTGSYGKFEKRSDYPKTGNRSQRPGFGKREEKPYRQKESNGYADTQKRSFKRDETGTYGSGGGYGQKSGYAGDDYRSRQDKPSYGDKTRSRFPDTQKRIVKHEKPDTYEYSRQPDYKQHEESGEHYGNEEQLSGKTSSRNRVLRKRKHHTQETQQTRWEDRREYIAPEEEPQHHKQKEDRENITPAKRKQLEKLQEEAMVHEELQTKGMRLNKYVATAGVCSRRHADELIAAGEITVNGEVITAMGHKVFTKDVVKYNGKLLSPSPRVYVLLNKPKNIITTAHDPEGRPTVIDLVKTATSERLYPVGRLDRNTTGLLLLTNDGDLAQQLAHPSSEIPKIYYVILNKPLLKEDLDSIAAGIMLEDGLAQVDEIEFVNPIDRRELGVNLHSGKNRVVRRLFEHLGYEVEKLDRVMYANLNKRDLPRGRWRYLSPREVRELRLFIANR